MLRFLYNYQVVTSFTQEVTNHALMLRCQPTCNNMQRVEEEHLVFSSIFRMHHGMDAYGNRIIYGGTREPHHTLAYVSTGIVAQGEYCIPDNNPAPYYRIPSRLTMPSDEMKEMVAEIDIRKPYDAALEISHIVNSLLQYAPATTLIGTSAAEALRQRKGVCQDFAHLMIALCRMKGITARYVNGFIMGEGETHAWVEVHDGYAWRAIDPTHDTFVYSGYIKLSHGRDALDCTVDRGIFMGVTRQHTKVNVLLAAL